MERGPRGPGRAPPFRLHARGARAVSGDARRRTGRVPGPAARAQRGTGGCLDERLARATRHRRPEGLQGRDAVARKPATGAADGRPRAQPRAARTRRASVGTRPHRYRRHRPGARRSGPGRVLRAPEQPPARSGGGSLRAGDHHRPRPIGRVGDGRRADGAGNPTARGPRRRRPERPTGPGACPASPCPRSTAAPSAWSSSPRSTATTSSGPPCGRVGSPSSPSSVAGSPRCSGRPCREVPLRRPRGRCGPRRAGSGLQEPTSSPGTRGPGRQHWRLRPVRGWTPTFPPLRFPPRGREGMEDSLGVGRDGGDARDQRARPGPHLPGGHHPHPRRRRRRHRHPDAPQQRRTDHPDGGGRRRPAAAHRQTRLYGRVREPGLRQNRGRALPRRGQGRPALRAGSTSPSSTAASSCSTGPPPRTTPPPTPASSRTSPSYLGVLKAYQTAGLTPAQAAQVDQRQAGPGPHPRTRARRARRRRRR